SPFCLRAWAGSRSGPVSATSSPPRTPPPCARPWNGTGRDPGRRTVGGGRRGRGGAGRSAVDAGRPAGALPVRVGYPLRLEVVGGLAPAQPPRGRGRRGRRGRGR